MKMTRTLKVTWLNSSLYDAARVAGTFMEVKEEFFQHHQFVVLPYPAADTVFLPDITYNDLLRVKHPATYHPEEFTSELLTTIGKQLDAYTSFKKISDSEIQIYFKQIHAVLEKTLKILFPQLYIHMSTVTVITTPYGAEGSFDYKKERNKYHFYIWVRTTGLTLDSIIAQLIHCLVSCFVLAANKEPDTKTQAWKQREAIIDFLLQHTELNTIWKDVHKTIPILESKQKSQKLLVDSQTYLKKWSSTITPPFISKKGNEYVIDSLPLHNLTEKEGKLFSILFEQKNKFVSKDELFEILYGEEGGSDWSLSKLIERLRNKILTTGIDYPLLITSRRQGYKLLSM